MGFIVDGSRTVVFNANVTGTVAVRRLVTARTHPEEAIETYLSYSSEICSLAAETSHRTRKVSTQRFHEFLQATDLAERRDRYAALRTAEILAYAMGGVPSKPLNLAEPPSGPVATNRVLQQLEIGLSRLYRLHLQFPKGGVQPRRPRRRRIGCRPAAHDT